MKFTFKYIHIWMLVFINCLIFTTLVDTKIMDYPADLKEKIDQEDENASDDTFYENLKKLEIPDYFALKEIVIGNQDAPISLVIYSSFTCNHCRKFHMEIFPEFKKKYVDTGKVKIYLRNYLDDVGALEAAILVRCFGNDNGESILKIYQTIFSEQEKWMNSNEPQKFLKNLFINDGYEQEKIDACLQDKKIPAGLMKEQQRAMQQLHIFSVPAFIRSDGQMHIGKITLEELEQFLNLNADTDSNSVH